MILVQWYRVQISDIIIHFCKLFTYFLLTFLKIFFHKNLGQTITNTTKKLFDLFGRVVFEISSHKESMLHVYIVRKYKYINENTKKNKLKSNLKISEF